MTSNFDYFLGCIAGFCAVRAVGGPPEQHCEEEETKYRADDDADDGSGTRVTVDSNVLGGDDGGALAAVEGCRYGRARNIGERTTDTKESRIWTIDV